MEVETSFADYEAALRREGFDEVLVREWQPNHDTGSHSHPFDAKALVVAGEMWLMPEGGPTQHLLAGDRFELDADVPHSERYGAEGATYWVGRRNKR